MKTKNIFLFLTIVFAVFFQSCQKEPSACFNIDKSEIKIGDTLNFSYCSINETYCKWDFGDGTTSTLERPIKIYDTAGVFRIKLTVYTQGGKKSDTLSKIVNVKGSAPSLQITVKDLISLSLIGHINVKLFTSFSDWQTMSNPVTSGLVDNTGIIIFSNLNATQYYIRAENANYTNLNLGNVQIVYILTDTLIQNYTYPFTAWVQTKPAPPTALQVLVKTTVAPQSPVSGVNVYLFATYANWLNHINPIASGTTNSSGIVTFNTNLNPVRYFIRAQNGQYNNNQSGITDSNNVITSTLIADTLNYYTALVVAPLHPPTSLHITVRTAFPPQNLVPNINVTLFTSYIDWQNATNPVTNGLTNASGVVTFNTNLNPVQYYVRVESPQLNNIQAGMANQNNVLTAILVADTSNTYTAFVNQNMTPPTALQVTVRTQGGMQQPVPNINVTLFNNYNDWNALLNPVMTGITDPNGIVVFTTNLNAQQYYVRAENAQFTNLAIGQMNQNSILTQPVILNMQNLFTAFVKLVAK